MPARSLSDIVAAHAGALRAVQQAVRGSRSTRLISAERSPLDKGIFRAADIRRVAATGPLVWVAGEPARASCSSTRFRKLTVGCRQRVAHSSRPCRSPPAVGGES